MFLAPKNFLGGSPKILDRDYKIERSNEHRANFRADRPTELGDYAARKKEKTTAKQKSFRKLSFSGGLINGIRRKTDDCKQSDKVQFAVRK